MKEKEHTVFAMKIFRADILPVFSVVALLIACVSEASAQESGRFKEIGRTTEKEIKVVLASSFGNVTISRGESGKIVSVGSQNAADESPRVNMDYTVRNRIGYLEVNLGHDGDEPDGKKRRVHVGKFDGGSWTLQFSDALPISFDIELGIGRGTFDMTGLQVKDFNLSSGASEVELNFGEENSLEIENLNVESGMSRFEGRNLSNAHFKNFHFQGGIGSYTLDFGGTLRNEVEVNVEVGLGFATIIVPKDAGARVAYEKNWVSKLDCDANFVSSAENEYLTDNYYRVSGKMNITLDSGLGSIKIRHR